jgi:hypothetical protein
MYTVRQLVKDAYRDSNVLGIGQAFTDDMLVRGIGLLNSILQQRQANGDFKAPLQALTVNFTGVDSYTIGPMPDLTEYPTAQVPDFVLPIAPSDIVEIVHISNAARIVSRPCSPTEYFNRGVMVTNNTLPTSFYYERSYPIATIRFYLGTPNSQGEIIYAPNYVNADANTDLSLWPVGLQPYLRWQLASDIAGINRWDAPMLALKAQQALEDWTRSNGRKYGYTADRSAAGFGHGSSTKFNIYSGEVL